MVGEYTGTSAIVDTAGVSGGEEAGYISIGCEGYGTGDVAGIARGADKREFPNTSAPECEAA